MHFSFGWGGEDLGTNPLQLPRDDYIGVSHAIFNWVYLIDFIFNNIYTVKQYLTVFYLTTQFLRVIHIFARSSRLLLYIVV